MKAHLSQNLPMTQQKKNEEKAICKRLKMRKQTNSYLNKRTPSNPQKRERKTKDNPNPNPGIAAKKSQQTKNSTLPGINPRDDPWKIAKKKEYTSSMDLSNL